MTFIAALPMYDWPERRAEVDAEWAAIRDRLRAAGVEAPQDLTRGLAEPALWRHPDLLLTQTCWGPMERGLAAHVQVVGQPSYDGIEGGEGALYSSAIVMRPAAGFTSPSRGEVAPPGGAGGGGESDASIPIDLLRNARFAYNGPESMSGIMGLARDLEAMGESLDIFASRIETGGHRNSVRAVAEGRADVAAIDCLSWRLAKLYEPAAESLHVVGWTAKRKGLPFITAKTTPPDVVAALKAACP